MDEASIQAKRERLAELNKSRAEAYRAKVEEMLAPYHAAQPEPELLRDVQFRHDPIYGRTYAIVAPTPDELWTAVGQLMNGDKNPKVNFRIGISRLNAVDNDQYSKYVGRVVSAAKLTNRLLTLQSCSIGAEQSFFCLRLDGITMDFQLSHGKVRPFLFQIYDESIREIYRERVKRLYRK